MPAAAPRAHGAGPPSPPAMVTGSAGTTKPRLLAKRGPLPSVSFRSAAMTFRYDDARAAAHFRRHWPMVMARVPSSDKTMRVEGSGTLLTVRLSISNTA